MARARSLKPGFFGNEDLLELPFEYRLLFAGLWTLADRAGRLGDRPKKIKLHVFPGDNVDVEAGLVALAKWQFIERYEVNGVRYIQITNWLKHQSPHVKEAASTIPAPCKPGSSTSVAALTPSSLTPDSLPPDSRHLDPESVVSAAKAEMQADGEMARALIPLGVQVSSIHPTLVAWVRDGITIDRATEAVARARQNGKPDPEPIPANYLDRILRAVARAPPQRLGKFDQARAEMGETKDVGFG